MIKEKEKNNFYLDYAAATPIDPRVQAEIDKNRMVFGNPSSLHSYGRKAAGLLQKSREKIASFLNAKSEEVFFCSGGSESDNWAIQGVARAREKEGKHIVISAIEHKAVNASAKNLQNLGFLVDFCPVDENGLIDKGKLESLVGDETILVSIIMANNEIGVIQDIAELVKIVKQKNVKTYFHTDACQAVNYLDIDVQKTGVDLMTLNGSKIYGPRSVGVLYIKKGTKIVPIIWGGGQENGMRAGTENVVEIVGMAVAMDIADKLKIQENNRLYLLREKIFSRLEKDVEGLVINGDKKKRLCNNVNISIPGVEGETLLLYLDEAGFAVSTGSACSASDLKPSHVLLAIGRSDELAHASLRITLGRYTSTETVDNLLNVIPGLVEKIRKMSAV
jgi:cysteine desulfurase